MRKFISFIVFIFLAILLAGCNFFSNEVKVTSLEIESTETNFDESFQLSDIKVKVLKSDGTFDLIPLTEDMLSDEDLSKFSEEGTHTINVSYLNAAASFTITITGEKGDDGREVALQVANGYIQWKYDTDTTWKNLIALSELTGATGNTGPTGEAGPTGPSGPSGNDGREVTFQVDGGYIQWKYVGDTEWVNLLDLNSLKGADGSTPTITISDDGFWVINGEKTTFKAVADSVNPRYYTVTFELNGGSMANGETAILENVEACSSLVLPVPTKEGYIFKGWFTGESVNDGQFTNISVVTRDITLYARWVLDLQPVYDYFNTFTTHNFTANMTANYSRVSDSTTIVTDSTNQIKIYEDSTGTYLYMSSSFTDYFNNELTHQRSDEQYRLYGKNTCFTLRYNQEDNSWTLRHYQDELELDFMFFEVDYENITKRQDANIYDIPVIIDMIGPKMIDNSNVTVEAYLDLDLNKLVITTIRESSDDGEPMTTTETLEIVLSDVGTTTVVIPIDTARQAVIDNINRIYQDKPIESATPESLQTLQDLIANMTNSINNETNIASLAYMQDDYVIQLENFQLEFDPLQQAKNSAKLYINNKFNELSETATQASITDMEVVRDLYLSKVDVCTTEGDVNNEIVNFDLDINAKFVVDPLIVELLKLKDQLYDSLDKIISSYNKVILYPEDSDDLSMIFSDYSFYIEIAETAEEAKGYYNQALSEIESLALQIDQDKFASLKSEKLGLIDDLYFDGLLHLRYFSDLIYNEYITQYNIINASIDVISLLDNYDTGVLALVNKILVEAKAEALNELQLIYEKYDYVVISEDKATLDSLYSNFTGYINNETEYYEVYNYVNDFLYNCENLQTDPIKYSKYSSIKYLEEEFEYLSSQATADSIINMENALNNAIVAIENCTTIVDVDKAYDNGYNALYSAFIIDSTKVDLLNAKDEAINKIDDYNKFVNQFISYDDHKVVWNLFYQYQSQILEATTVSDVQNLYNQWYLDFTSLNLTYDNLQFAKDELLLQLNTDFSYVSNDISVSEDDITQFNNYCNLINASNDAIEIYEMYNQCYDFLDSLYVNASKQTVLADLLENYNYYNAVINDDEVAELTATYQQAVNNVNNAFTEDEIYDELFSFLSYCDSLTTDDLKLAKYNCISSLINEFETLSITATDNSIIDMQATLDTYIPLIETSLTVTDVENQYSIAYDELQSKYVLDNIKQELDSAKLEALNNMFKITIYFQYILANESDRLILNDLYYASTVIIESSTTVVEVQSNYDNWYNTLINYNFILIDDSLAIAKTDVLNSLASELGDYSYVPDDVYTAYQNYVTEINNATSIYQVLDLSIQCSKLITSIALREIQQESLGYINYIYNIYLSQVIADELSNLQATYDQCVLDIQNTQYVENIVSIVQYFSDYCNELQLDPVKEEINYSINELKSHLEELKLTATDDSITQMELAYNTQLDLIRACTTIDDVLLKTQEAYVAINNAYVEDAQKVALLSKKEDTIDRMYDFTMILSSYLLYDEDQHYTWNFYVQNEELIYQASTIEQVVAIYTNWYNTLVSKNLVLTDSGLSDAKTTLLQDLAYEYSYIENPSVDFDTQYQTYINTINTATTIFDVYFAYYDCYQLLLNEFIEQERNYVISEIDELYSDIRSIVLDSYIAELDATYVNILDLLESKSNIDEFYDLLYTFSVYVDTLPIDPLKEAIYYAVDSLLLEFEYLSKTATDASIIAMQASIDTNIPLIQASTSDSDVNINYDVAFTELFSAYEEDPVKAELAREKLNMISNLYDMTARLENFLVNTSDSEPLWDLCYQFEDYINNAATVDNTRDLYAIFRSTLEGYNFAFVENALVDAKNELLGILFDEISYLPELNDEYDTQITSYINQIQASENLYVLHDLYFECYDYIQSCYVIVEKAISIELISNEYDYFSVRLLEPALTDFINTYNQYLTDINNCNTVYSINVLEYEFIYEYCITLTVDDFLCYKYDTIDYLNDDYKWLAESASDSDITEMQAILDHYFPLIIAATTYEEIDILHSAAYDDLYAFDTSGL